MTTITASPTPATATVTVDDVRRAAERLQGQVENTPCVHSARSTGWWP